MIILTLSTGCVSPKNENLYATITPTVVTSPEFASVSTVQVTPSPSQTQRYIQYLPKFEWGDVIEDPFSNNKFIILEGNPEVSGVYTVYQMLGCPYVSKEFIDVQLIDKKFRKVGTQNPDTVCGGAQLIVLEDSQDGIESYTMPTTTTQSYYWIKIIPISDKKVGDKFVITGLTNLQVSSKISIFVKPVNFWEKPTEGQKNEVSGEVNVLLGTSGINTWTFPIDFSSFIPGKYVIEAEAYEDNNINTTVTIQIFP